MVFSLLISVASGDSQSSSSAFASEEYTEHGNIEGMQGFKNYFCRVRECFTDYLNVHYACNYAPDYDNIAVNKLTKSNK